MITEENSVTTTLDSVDLQKNEWVTVREAIIREGVSEKSVYNRINSGYYTVKIDAGKKFILLPKKTSSVEASEQGLGRSERTTEVVQNVSEAFLEQFQKYTERLTEEVSELRIKLDETNRLLLEARERVSRLEGEMSGKDAVILAKDETIQAKEQAINAANAAVMLMEQQKQTLEAEMPKQLSGSRGIDEKKGWLDKLLGR